MSKADRAGATNAYDFPLIIKHLLHTPLSHAKHREIVYGDHCRYNYETFRDRVGQLGAALTALGIKPGDTVGVLDWDSHRYLECFFAVPMLGAVLHTVNIRLSPEQLLYTINHAEDDLLLVHVDFLRLIEQIKPRFYRKIPLLIVGENVELHNVNTREFEKGEVVGEYEALLAPQDGAYDFEDFDENTTATTFYTTGTTGDPKGVYYSHRQIVLHTLGAASALGVSGITRDTVYMPMTPMFHVHAWGVPYVATMLGLKQVYPGRYEPAKLLALKDAEGVTFSHCVPTILHMLLNHPDAETRDLAGWTIIIGGSALPYGLGRAALDRGLNVFGGYGMSETCPMLTLVHLEPKAEELDSDEQLYYRCKAGRAIPLVDIHIVDEQMQPIAHDGQTTGEVVVRAPWLTKGYVKQPDASEKLWEGGYLHTGDIGHIDKEGYLKVTDRLKDVIKSGGEWISSTLLEDILSEHSGVSEAAAIGIADAKWGERPMAIVVIEDDGPDEKALKAHVAAYAERGTISKWAVPERVVFVNSIDRTSVGKIDKKRLRERFA